MSQLYQVYYQRTFTKIQKRHNYLQDIQTHNVSKVIKNEAIEAGYDMNVDISRSKMK